MKKISCWIKNLCNQFKRVKEDPIKGCKLYNEMGCSFVDSPFCDFPKCSMLKNYIMPNVLVYSQNDFDEKCKSLELTDDNVEEKEDMAFISIIGTEQVIQDYLGEYGTKHYFNQNHSNVLNLEFDDVSHDFDFKYKPMKGNNERGEARIIHFKTISEEQAQQCIEFIEKNLEKKFLIHCRAGRSRSQAIFRFITDFYEIYKSCKGNLDNPCLTPNQEVVRKLKRAYYEKYNIFVEDSTK